MVANIKGHLNLILNEKVIGMMNITFSKAHWPILIYFVWREKLGILHDGVTHKNLREDGFNKETVRIHLNNLCNARKPFVEEISGLYAITKYKLTPFGQKIAYNIWTILNGYSKMFMEQSMEEIAAERKKMHEINFQAEEVDDEELFVREIEEKARKAEEAKKKKAGIVETPNGMVVDLDKIKVRA